MEQQLLVATVANMRNERVSEVGIAEYLTEHGATPTLIGLAMGRNRQTIINWLNGSHRPIADIRQENHAKRQSKMDK